MADKKTVCNEENGCMSELFGRNCWITNSMLGLIESHVETLFEQSDNAATDKALQSVTDYIKELKQQNKEYWYEDFEVNA